MIKQNCWIQALWPAPENIHAGTSTRVGGKSCAPYDHFNLAAHVGDEPDRLNENRNILNDRLDLPSQPIWIKQVHGNTVLDAAEAREGSIADGLYSNKPHSVCAILTADCAPVLICNNSGTEIASVHAGWRGLCQGVIQHGLEKFSSDRTDLMAWIGPHINTEAYTVRSDMYEACTEALGDHISKAFTRVNHDVFHADLGAMVSLVLRTHGVTDIYVSEYCCYKEQDLFYSYRRDGQTGRMASLIWMQ